MSAKRNKTAGSNWERECIDKLSKIYKRLITTRLGSKDKDNSKIDIMVRDEHIHGSLEFEFQCKNLSTNVNVHDVISDMKKHGAKKPIILFKKTKKINERFMVQGEYACLELKLLIELLTAYENQKQKVSE